MCSDDKNISVLYISYDWCLVSRAATLSADVEENSICFDVITFEVHMSIHLLQGPANRSNWITEFYIVVLPAEHGEHIEKEVLQHFFIWWFA